MTETEKRSTVDQPIKTLVQLRNEARASRTGFEVNENNLRFHSLPDFMEEAVQNGARILVDMGGNIFILGWHDRK